MRRLLGCLLVTAGCYDSALLGLAPTPAGSGPTVVFDTGAKPVPEIPLPNDLATRTDLTSPTGRRVNVSMLAPTSAEARFRARLDRLDGFSTFGPITAGFDAPLDVAALLARHGAGVDPEDDAVFVIDLETGAAVPLDIGGGAYPVTVEDPRRYYPFDARGDGTNLMLESVNEDLDGDGVLDPGEDTDADGRLDVANTLTPGGRPEDDLMTFYERETNTLLLRPLLPLRPAHTYAVVLTTRLVGEDGSPTRSPFPWVHHLQQTEALRPLVRQLPGLGVGLDEVAFAWSFTTQTTTRDLEHLRMGLYGRGPFRALAAAFPPDTNLDRMYDDPQAADVHPFIATRAALQPTLQQLAELLIGNSAIVDDLFTTFEENVAYVAMPRATVPVLLDGTESVFDLDAATERLVWHEGELPWSVVIPKTRGEQRPPFPVAIYVHGTGGSRLEGVVFGARLARFGIATVGFDAYAHGLANAVLLEQLVIAIMQGEGFGVLAEALLDNRTIDVNHDGERDPAGDFWTADVFHSRDTVRQASLEVMRLVQIMRGFDGVRTWRLHAPEVEPIEGLAGDFDGDGVIDIGGPDNDYFLFGNSLGGIVTAVTAAVEPALTAAVPMSGGGGLTDLSGRSVQTGVPEAVLLPVIGPLVIGPVPDADGEPSIAFHVPSAYREADVPVHAMVDVAPGDEVVVHNLGNGEVGRGVVSPAGTFRVSLPCDLGDAIRLEVWAPGGARLEATVDTFDRDTHWGEHDWPAGQALQAVAGGLGIPRQTPAMRRLLQLAQTAVDPGDPVNYAPHYRGDLLFADYPDVQSDTKVAVAITIGDMNVPISTGATLARAAGLIPFAEPLSPHRRLVQGHVLEGLERLRRFSGPPHNDPREILMDPDNLSQGTDGFGVPRFAEPLRLRAGHPDGGVSVARFFYADPWGRHSILLPDPSRAFDVDRFALNAVGRYFASRGTVWSDELCQADDTCGDAP